MYILCRKKEKKKKKKDNNNNSNIVIGSKAFVYKKYVEKGIIFINDLCDELGNLRTFENFTKMYNIKTNFLEYGSLIRAVKCFIGQLDNIKIPNNGKLFSNNC